MKDCCNWLCFFALFIPQLAFSQSDMGSLTFNYYFLSRNKASDPVEKRMAEMSISIKKICGEEVRQEESRTETEYAGGDNSDSKYERRLTVYFSCVNKVVKGRSFLTGIRTPVDLYENVTWIPVLYDDEQPFVKRMGVLLITLQAGKEKRYLYPITMKGCAQFVNQRGVNSGLYYNYYGRRDSVDVYCKNGESAPSLVGSLRTSDQVRLFNEIEDRPEKRSGRRAYNVSKFEPKDGTSFYIDLNNFEAEVFPGGFSIVQSQESGSPASNKYPTVCTLLGKRSDCLDGNVNWRW